MGRFEQDSTDFHNFLKRKRKLRNTPISECAEKPVFSLEDKTELAQKYNEKRLYKNAKNKAFLQHLTKESSYNNKGKQKILDYVSDICLDVNNLYKELEDEKNCECSREREGLPRLEPKPKKESKKGKKYNVRKRRKRKGIYRTLLGVDGGSEEIEVVETRPLIDFKQKNTWIGLIAIAGIIYLMKKD